MPGLHKVQVNIRIHKYVDKGKNYLIEAIAEGHTAPSTAPKNNELGEVVSCAGKKLRTAICIGWKVTDGEYGGDSDEMGWQDALTLLKMASKKAYNQFGEERGDTEASELSNTFGRCFELDDRQFRKSNIDGMGQAGQRSSSQSFLSSLWRDQSEIHVLDMPRG